MPLLFLLPMLKHFINNKYTAADSAKETRTSVLFETNKGSASLDPGWGIQSFLKSSITFRFMLVRLGLSPSHFATGAPPSGRCTGDRGETDRWRDSAAGEVWSCTVGMFLEGLHKRKRNRSATSALPIKDGLFAGLSESGNHSALPYYYN